MNRTKLFGALLIAGLALVMITAGFSGPLFARGSWHGGGRGGVGWGPPRTLVPGTETGNIVYTVCKIFDPGRNCNRCSDYFTVRSEDEAQNKCAKSGYEDVYYFPSVSRVYSWMGGHCTCGGDDEEP